MGGWETFSKLLGLGLEPKELSLVQVCLRGVIVFLASIVIVRVADRRFLAKLTALDAILAFMLGSTLARAINGSAAFFPSLAVGFVLVALHRLISLITFHSKRLDRIVKGEAEIVVTQGKPNLKALRGNHISEKDLMEEVRLNGRVGSLDDVRTATVERSGEISVVPKDRFQRL